MALEAQHSQMLLTPGNVNGHFGEAASANNKSLSIHRWANWIAGFSGGFARSAITQYLPFPTRNSVVMDPFAGVGTTLVEANRLGLDSIGFEINPFAHLVSSVKLRSKDISLEQLTETAALYEAVMEKVEQPPGQDGCAADARLGPRRSPPPGFKSRIPFYSPAVEERVLFTLDFLDGLTPPVQDIFRVAFASVMVEFSNYTYEPSLGSRPGAGKDLVTDAPVGGIVAAKLRQMLEDIAEFQADAAKQAKSPDWQVYDCSFFEAESRVDPGTVDLVVTSPPYMNNYHYVRNSRPQLFWTGLVASPAELKRLEHENFGKFWQTVRAEEPVLLIPDLPSLRMELEEIRGINSGRGVYGGNGWANYICTYMNDLDRFCKLLVRLLRPGGTAIVVLGNSIVQGREIKVEECLCDIAKLNDLAVVRVQKLRERTGSSIINSGARLHTRSKAPLYDAAVVLRRSC